jgi:hypothetical protein
MNQLEKEALNDPFLMEALEGYNGAGIRQENNLADIHSRLQDRIGKKEKRIIPWRMISIAASILIVSGIGGLWLINDHTVIKPQTIARINKTKPAPPVKKSTQLLLDSELNASKPVKKQLEYASLHRHKKPAATSTVSPVAADAAPSGYNNALADISPTADKVLKKPTIDSSNEVVVVGYGTRKRTDVTGSVSAINPSQITNKDLSQAKVANTATGLEGKVSGLQISSGDTRTIRGTVTGKDDGLPLPGVTVKVRGTNIAVTTNSKGEFVIGSVPPGAMLQFSFIGYESQVAYIKGSNLNVAMSASGQSLSEVVVTSALGVKKDDDPGNSSGLPDDAKPANGWSNYHKYLKQNSKSPDGKKGTVKLSFIVNSDNSLSDFKIVRSVSAQTDSTAIQLVKNGPRWYRNTDTKPQKMKLKIKFSDK